MKYVHAAIHTKARRHITGINGGFLLVTISLLIFRSTSEFAWADNYAPQLVMPGIGIGPAKLGMAQGLARQVLAAAGLDRHECAVDVLTDHDRVTALGTAFGGCITLPLPAGSAQFIVTHGLLLPKAFGIGGSPDTLSQAFGVPARFMIDPTKAILLWPNGLVVRTVALWPGEMITYIAVVPPHTHVPPYPLVISGT